ncbi:MAG: DUF2188 domain-containing protein [Acidimicrobiales bacterium]
MARATVHTFATDSGWVNQRSRAGAIRTVYRTRAEAQRAGQEIARRDRTEHVVHATDGKVLARSSFA